MIQTKLSTRKVTKRPLFEQLYQISKKLVLVLATSALIIRANKENVIILN